MKKRTMVAEYFGWLTAMGIAFSVSPVSAYNFGATWVGSIPTDNVWDLRYTGVWLANDNSHVVAGVNLDQAYDNQFVTGVNSLDVFSQFFASYQNDTQCNWSDDVCMWQLSFPTIPNAGWNACYTLGPGTGANTECNLSFVIINDPVASTLGNTALRALACHEVGHSVGLQHTLTAGRNTCMRGDANWVNFATPDAHDDNHLTVEY